MLRHCSLLTSIQRFALITHLAFQENAHCIECTISLLGDRGLANPAERLHPIAYLRDAGQNSLSKLPYMLPTEAQS